MKPLVIYHANCADGFTAAWAVRQAMDAEFHPGVYGEAPPEVAGRDVILVDFCYPFDVLMQLGLSARSVLVLDHHKSAEASLTSGNCYVGQAGLARLFASTACRMRGRRGTTTRPTPVSAVASCARCST